MGEQDCSDAKETWFLLFLLPKSVMVLKSSPTHRVFLKPEWKFSPSWSWSGASRGILFLPEPTGEPLSSGGWIPSHHYCEHNERCAAPSADWRGIKDYYILLYNCFWSDSQKSLRSSAQGYREHMSVFIPGIETTCIQLTKNWAILAGRTWDL